MVKEVSRVQGGWMCCLGNRCIRIKFQGFFFIVFLALFDTLSMNDMCPLPSCLSTRDCDSRKCFFIVHIRGHTNTQTHTYTRIYSHPQTYYVVSNLFNVVRHAGRLKLGSKPAQFRCSVLPLTPKRPTSVREL